MRNKLIFFIPSIPGIIFLFLFIMLVFQTPSQLLVDCDTGLHIKIGEFILNTFSVPGYDIFYATTPPIQYIAYEWLSQSIMALFYYHFGGLTGIVIFFSFFISLTYYLLFRILRKESDNIIMVTCISLLVICASSVLWHAKPHIFSVLIFIICYYILDLYQYKNKDYTYILPAIMILWVNLHGAFILGFTLCGIYFLGNILQIFLSKDSEQVIHITKAKKLFLIILLMIMASLLNPNGVKGLMQPFTVISNSVLKNSISSYLSPDFHSPDIFPFGILLLLTIVIFSLANRAKSVTEILLAVLFTGMALYSVRNISFFSVIVAPILIRQSDQTPFNRPNITEIILVILSTAGALYFAGFLLLAIIIIPILAWHLKKLLTANQESPIDSAADTGDKSIFNITSPLKDYFWIFFPLIFIMALAVAGHINHCFDESIKPVAAVEFLKREPIKGNMYNDYNFGTYIIYSAYPQYRVFIDGRAEMYGAERLKDYYRIRKIEPGWDRLLRKYDINFIIISHRSILSQFLLKDNTWRLIYADQVADIFIKNTRENKLLIEKYSDKRL